MAKRKENEKPDNVILSRRRFLRNMSLSAAGAAVGMTGLYDSASAFPFKREKSGVSFITGSDRREMVFQALKPFRKEIEEGIGDKQVVIKINLVANIDPLSNTHPDAVRGLLDFLAPIYKKKITIAECTLSKDNIDEISEEYGYAPLKKEYNIKMVELHDQSTTPMSILGKNLHPLGIEIIDTFLDPDNYFFSITPPKTHDVVVVTLGLKNLVMASPMKNTSLNCKYLMHGMGPWWLNYNMFVVAQRVRPQFTVIDGLEGMEGDGPIHGTRVEHGFALAGPDVVAVDRIAVDLMGFDIADIGYLNYCADAGLGIIDRSKIKILGSKNPDDFVIKYKPHKAFKYQLYWKKDIAIEGWDPADLPY